MNSIICIPSVNVTVFVQQHMIDTRHFDVFVVEGIMGEYDTYEVYGKQLEWDFVKESEIEGHIDSIEMRLQAEKDEDDAEAFAPPMDDSDLYY